MKSAAKVPFKKKTPYNLNEVDVNLLLKNPSHIRKIVKGNNKEEHYHDEDEEEEDEEEKEDDKLDKHMKRYISEYFDNKYKKESGQRKKVKQRFDIIDEYMPKFPYNAVKGGKTLKEIKDGVQKRFKSKDSE